jgi:fatty-acid desaturase
MADHGSRLFTFVKDLEKDPIVMWQHRHYWTLVWATNLGFPLVLGLLFGDLSSGCCCWPACCASC